MRSRYGTVCLFALCCTILVCGCSQDGSEKTSAGTADDWSATSPDQNAVRTPDDKHVADLRLQLKTGDRFPLRKVVEQELIQDSKTGSKNQISTRLELMFAISVIEQVEDRTQLKVRYEQVKFLSRIGNEVVEFDSTRQAGDLPVSLMAYRDMVGDGFTFWIGPDNQIVSVDGFTEFINRCLRNVPEAERHQVALGIEAGSGESGIANFIDNSIGLLPYSGEYKPGDSWVRPSHIGRPVPMIVNNKYTVTHLDEKTATFEIRGKITPSTTMTSSTEKNGVRVTVQGGETQGNCTIFRETGLPQRSRVVQNIDMTVMLAGAEQFQQRKKVTTTIESFPASPSATPHVIHFGEQLSRNPQLPQAEQGVRQVSGP